MVTVTKKAWLAGILDGEGTLFHYMGGENKSVPVFRIYLVNSSVPMMREASEIMSGILGHNVKVKEKYYNNETSVIKSNAQMYVIEICRQADVLMLLMHLAPFMVAKQGRAFYYMSILNMHEKGKTWNKEELRLISQIPVETEYGPPDLPVGMKRQSDLMGNHESAAEMTAPLAPQF